jgi:hypothetical protein
MVVLALKGETRKGVIRSEQKRKESGGGSCVLAERPFELAAREEVGERAEPTERVDSVKWCCG